MKKLLLIILVIFVVQSVAVSVISAAPPAQSPPIRPGHGPIIPGPGPNSSNGSHLINPRPGIDPNPGIDPGIYLTLDNEPNNEPAYIQKDNTKKLISGGVVASGASAYDEEESVFNFRNIVIVVIGLGLVAWVFSK